MHRLKRVLPRKSTHDVSVEISRYADLASNGPFNNVYDKRLIYLSENAIIDLYIKELP